MGSPAWANLDAHWTMAGRTLVHGQFALLRCLYSDAFAQMPCSDVPSPTLMNLRSSERLRQPHILSPLSSLAFPSSNFSTYLPNLPPSVFSSFPLFLWYANSGFFSFLFSVFCHHHLFPSLKREQKIKRFDKRLK